MNAQIHNHSAQGSKPLSDTQPTPPPADLPVEVWGATDKGREREGNEDAIYPHSGSVTGFVPNAERVAQRGRMLVVADGVGGGMSGRQASRLAADAAVERYYDLSGPDLGVDLRTAVETANAALYHYLQSTNAANAGSTMAAAVIHGNTLYVANVGDSRVYLLRGGKAYQLTNDHTLTQQKLSQGLISAEKALTDPDRNVLTRSLGTRPTVQVDLFPPQRLHAGDVVLVCSDGLVDMLTDEEIVRLVANRTPKRAAQRLIAAANHRGGFDNISVVIARVGGAGAAAGPAKGVSGLLSSLGQLSAKQKVILAVLAALVVLTFCLLAGLAWVTTSRPPQPPTATATPPIELSPTVQTVESGVPGEATATATPSGRATSTPAPTSTPTPTNTPRVRQPTPTATQTPEPSPTTETPSSGGGEGGGGGSGGGGGQQQTPVPTTIPPLETPTKQPPP